MGNKKVIVYLRRKVRYNFPGFVFYYNLFSHGFYPTSGWTSEKTMFNILVANPTWDYVFDNNLVEGL